MSRSRRPSISIYDYPEHLNPFNDDTTNSQPIYHEGKTSTQSKHKFWTFGRSRKKRSNSLSIKSTWNGLFGKRKEPSEPIEKKSTITTVSTAYKEESYTRPIAPPRLSKDQQEFDEALGTLTRRRKYTLDNASRYNSSLTVNGDPARIYDGSPQDTTTSIMGDLTPKPPARRFGQVSPRPTDKIPPLNFENKAPKQNGNINLPNEVGGTPVPPLRRFGNRSSQRLNGGTLDVEEEINQSGDISLRDENENLAEDYIFKRFNQDAVRRSNVSINSCISTASTYGRKKRKAPQPPKRKEELETSLENDGNHTVNQNKIEFQITEPIDIVKVTENIDEMTKSCEINESQEEKQEAQLSFKTIEEIPPDNIAKNITEDEKHKTSKVQNADMKETNSKEDADGTSLETEFKSTSEEIEFNNLFVKNSTEQNIIDIEYKRTTLEKVEIIKDIDEESEEVCLKKTNSGNTLSRSDSFSVKEEIEKIERQIKALESKNASNEAESDNNSARLSIQANRRHFFENMVDEQSGVKIEFKELPREQKDIQIVRLTDSPVPMVTSKEPVKVIELHISEPIRHKPELLDDVNPIPKPRRHSTLNLNISESKLTSDKNTEDNDDRGKSF